MEIVPKTRATSFAFLHRPLTAELPPSYSHASQSMHARLAFPPRSLQRSSPPKLSPSFTVHHVVRRFHLAPFSGGPPKLFPRFFRAISSYFHAFHSVRARAFLPSFLPSFLPCLSSSSVSLPSQQSKLNENPSIGDAFGKNALTN